jgi:hypothetical protein
MGFSEPIYIDHYNSIFEQLWDISIDAKDRIDDIEEGVDLADIAVIPRSGNLSRQSVLRRFLSVQTRQSSKCLCRDVDVFAKNREN